RPKRREQRTRHHRPGGAVGARAAAGGYQPALDTVAAPGRGATPRIEGPLAYHCRDAGRRPTAGRAGPGMTDNPAAHTLEAVVRLARDALAPLPPGLSGPALLHAVYDQLSAHAWGARWFGDQPDWPRLDEWAPLERMVGEHGPGAMAFVLTRYLDR